MGKEDFLVYQMVRGAGRLEIGWLAFKWQADRLGAGGRVGRGGRGWARI